MGKKSFAPGKIITFYSYKGGTGRSMALANISCLLAKRLKDSSQKILIIDWDLEAPGLHRYFSEYSEQVKELDKPGLINYFHDLKRLLEENPNLYKKIGSPEGFKVLNKKLPLENYIIVEPLKGIDFLTAGRFDPHYPEFVNSFDWAVFFDQYRRIFDAFRELISSKYAYCLIDSRTGLTDISGICSIIMPEKLVTVFTPNNQSIYGLIDIVENAVKYRCSSNDFRPLAVFPLPSRIESSDQKLKAEWRLKYQNEFGILFQRIYDLERCDLSSYFNQIQLPHMSDYSYGEKIAVLEESQRDALSLSTAYERFLHYLVDYDFAWQDKAQSHFVFPIDHELTTLEETSQTIVKGTPSIKVVISSTYEDLKEYRFTAIEVLNRFKYISLSTEYFSSVPAESKTICDDKIKACDVFIGIYAHRYGFIPEGETKSVIQLEYELAKKLNKDCFCFIVKEDFSWNPKYIEMGKYAELKAFLDMVKTQQTVQFFESVKDFEGKFATSMGELRARMREDAGRGRRIAGKVEDRGCAPIPISPTPFIAHPYPMPENFTGRVAEQALLSHWVFNEKEPVLVLEATGGMGKTALTWVWLQKIVMERGQEFAGVFWWSFYESPFEEFIQKLAYYVLGMEDRGDSGLSVDMVDLQAALHKGKFLLVLDGLERILTGYSDMNAAYTRDEGFQGGNNTRIKWEKRQRVPVQPQEARFLTYLASPTGKTKTLITTRLMPLPLEGLVGVKHVFLMGLNPDDAMHFLSGEGVVGTRAELEQAANLYGNHPLMLKMLAFTVKRSRSKDIRAAARMGLIDNRVPHKILTTMYNLLSEEERRVAAVISVNRGAFDFQLAHALLPDMEEDTLWRVLMELRDLGFIFYEERQDRLDFHPILRSFLYDKLTDRKEVHYRAVKYLQTLPKLEKVVTMEDLLPLIELYYHLVRVGKFDEAIVLFRDRIFTPIYYQLSVYSLIIDMLKELFLNGKDEFSLLNDVNAQGWTLNVLANAYSMLSLPQQAVPLYLNYLDISERRNDFSNLAIGLEAIASLSQLHLCLFSAASGHLLKSTSVSRDLQNEGIKLESQTELTRIMAYQGLTKSLMDARLNDQKEFNEAYKFFETRNNIQMMSVASAYRSLAAVLQGRLSTLLPVKKNQANAYFREALARARESLQYCGLKAKERPNQRDFIRSYWLLGETLVHCSLYSVANQLNPFDLTFYDEYFQEPIESLSIASDSELTGAERCLHESLRRCRKANLVELEPSILLSLARLEGVKILSFPKNKIETSFVEIESLLSESMEIALRAGFRLNLADIHLFAGQFLVENKENFKGKITLLGYDASQHLQKAKEFALDVSEFSDLYQSPNPDFYKGIPEYEMLKRGMTQEERIKNGYYVAYQCAELLMKQMNTD